MKLISGLAAVALAATTLAQPLLAPASAATDVPAPAGARASTGWLATQLTDGVIYNPNFGGFEDYGLTIDIGISMDEVGGDQALVRQIRQAMTSRVASYATGVDYGAPDDLYSGSFAKALVFAQVSGANARDYGGFDLVRQVEDRVISSGPSAGRLADQLGGADYANSFGQALAARGLSVAGSDRSAPVTDFLLQQQCSSGYFRTFFTADRTAPNQSCVEGTDPTDTDTTAFVVTQLAAVSPRSARADAAIRKAVAWLASAQRSDGSFVGSAFTPDPNTNSTGLAASALAAGGKCAESGRAAEWVESLQVGQQPAASPLAGEEGALPYDSVALANARSGGITQSTRDQWWRATVQAVAGLTHARGSTTNLKMTSAGTEPGQQIALTATGAKVGERFCLSGPGITGTRSVAVGSDGVLRSAVTLPAASGPATYTLTGRDGATTHTVTVKSATARGSIAGVRMAGPAGFRPAGSKAVLEVVGAAPGGRYQLRGPGLDVTVVAGSDGELTRTVTLPDATTTASYVLFGEDGQVTDDTRVLGKQRLKVSAQKTDGARKRIVVRKLVAGEKVRIIVAGKVLATGRADDEGRFARRIELSSGKVKVRVRAVGQFPALRSGATVVTLR